MVRLSGSAAGRSGVAEEQKSICTSGSVSSEVEAKGFTCSALRETGDESALLVRDVRAAVGEELLDLLYGQRSQTHCGAAGADGREQFAGVFREDEEVNGVRWFLKNFEQRVRGLLHEAGRCEDEDLARRFAGQVMGPLDEGADLAEFDEQLRWVGRDDEDVGMRLDQDAGVLFVGLAELFAGGYGFVDFVFEVDCAGDAGAVVTDAAEAGERLSVGPEIAGLALAFDGHGEHEGEGVLSRSAGAGQDERVRESTGGDGGPKMFDG